MKFNRELPALLSPSANDVREQMSHLIYRGFVSKTPHKWLVHLPRYAKAADVRLKKLFNAGAARDSINLAIIRPLWEQYLRRMEVHRKNNIFDPGLTEFRWMLEEFRVSLFAQELKTAFPISAQRLEAQWAKVRNV
jgi:ATP-dependent helicase HrpA